MSEFSSVCAPKSLGTVGNRRILSSTVQSISTEIEIGLGWKGSDSLVWVLTTVARSIASTTSVPRYWSLTVSDGIG